MEDKRLNLLEELVEELLNESPNEDFIKEKMNKVGLEYTNDQMKRINLVLKSLHGNDVRTESMSEGVI